MCVCMLAGAQALSFLHLCIVSKLGGGTEELSTRSRSSGESGWKEGASPFVLAWRLSRAIPKTSDSGDSCWRVFVSELCVVLCIAPM